MEQKVLIVEDDPRWCRMLGDVVEDLGYRAFAATRFPEAKQLLGSLWFDLVLVDIDLDGFGFKGEGGQLFYLLCERYPQLPVIAITATVVARTDIRDLFVECNIKDLVEKGAFNVKRFRDLIRTLVSTNPAPVITQKGVLSDTYSQLREALLDCGPFESDSELKAVFVDARIRPWRDSIPQANKPITRVESVIDLLHDRWASDGEQNALVLLLRVLSERHDPADACRPRLTRLADDLATALLPTPVSQPPGFAAMSNAELRHWLNQQFDDPGLEAFLLDYFPEIYDKLGRGLRKDEKLTVLLEHCHRQGPYRRRLLAALSEQAESAGSV